MAQLPERRTKVLRVLQMRFFLLLLMVGLCVPVGVIKAGEWLLDLGDSEFPLTPHEELKKQKLEKEKKKKEE